MYTFFSGNENSGKSTLIKQMQNELFKKGVERSNEIKLTKETVALWNTLLVVPNIP